MAATATQQATTPKPRGGGGGAWETVVDRAALEVTNYLAATTQPFDPTGPLSHHLLALLDRGTLLDIVKERNFGGLCGRLGCPERPSGLEGDCENNSSGNNGPDFSRWRYKDGAEGGRGSDSSSGSDSDSSSSSSDDHGDGERLVKPKKSLQHRTTTTTNSSRHSAKNRRSARHELRQLRDLEGDSDSGEEGEEGGRNGMVKEGRMRLSAVTDDPSEIVYDDDIQIAEAFRLAAREQLLLRRLQRKREKEAVRHRQQRVRAAASASAAVQAPPPKPPKLPLPTTGAQSGMLGATLDERFCGPLCLEAFQDDLLPRVRPYLDYGDQDLVAAVSGLFPNLRPDVLGRLAGLEAGATTALVKDVTERSSGGGEEGQRLRPVVIGGSSESTLTRATLDKKDTSATATATGRPSSGMEGLAEATAAQMARRDTLWDAAVVYRISRDAFKHSGGGGGGSGGVPVASPPSTAAATAVGKGLKDCGNSGSGSDGDGDGEDEDGIAAPVHPSVQGGMRPLQGPLLVIDFLMNVSSATTKKLFAIHHHARYAAAGDTNHDAAAAAAPPSYYDRLVGPVRTVLARKAAALLLPTTTTTTTAKAAWELLYREGDALRVDPSLQQQRRELAVSQLFATDLAAALSRLAWIDVDAITDVAWEGVWYKPTAVVLGGAITDARQHHHNKTPNSNAAAAQGQRQQQYYMSYSLLNSLVFPFAVPSALLRPLGATGAMAPPEVLALGAVMLLAAGLCSPAVEAAVRQREEQLEEVLFAVGMSDDDTTAALGALVLSEDD